MEEESNYAQIYQKNHFIVKTVDFSLDKVPKTDLFITPFAILTAWNPNNVKLIEKYSQKMEALVDKVILNEKQNQQLEKLRDWLLPMLMNGQVKVS